MNKPVKHPSIETLRSCARECREAAASADSTLRDILLRLAADCEVVAEKMRGGSD